MRYFFEVLVVAAMEQSFDSKNKPSLIAMKKVTFLKFILKWIFHIVFIVTDKNVEKVT